MIRDLAAERSMFSGAEGLQFGRPEDHLVLDLHEFSRERFSFLAHDLTPLFKAAPRAVQHYVQFTSQTTDAPTGARELLRMIASTPEAYDHIVSEVHQQQVKIGEQLLSPAIISKSHDWKRRMNSINGVDIFGAQWLTYQAQKNATERHAIEQRQWMVPVPFRRLLTPTG